MKTKYFKNEKKMLAYIQDNISQIVAVYEYKGYICVITKDKEV